MELKSWCGIANLLGAITGIPSDRIKRKFGLPVPEISYCPNCGAFSSRAPRYYPYCFQCGCKHTRIDLECFECHLLFKRRRSTVIYNIKHGQEYPFHSKRCYGKWLARTHGFTVHPENAIHGQHSQRKWDKEIVWAKHFETGYGAVRLSRLLHIPVSTISNILRTKNLLPLSSRAKIAA